LGIGFLLIFLWLWWWVLVRIRKLWCWVFKVCSFLCHCYGMRMMNWWWWFRSKWIIGWFRVV
jgi:hypothetical protein